MKIGSRLTLWGTLIALVICAAVCVTLYVGLDISLHGEVDRFLVGEVQEFLAILGEEEDETLEEIERDIRQELGSRLHNDLTFRLLDQNGKLVVTSDPDDRLPNPWPLGPQEHAAGNALFESVALARPNTNIRVCSQRVRLSGRGDFIVQATYMLDDVASSLARFRNLCLVVMAFALGLSVIGGRILARKSLRPIHAMAKIARRIGGEDLSKRLSRSGNGDELDHLAAVLNEMLGRLERQFEQVQQFTADAAHELRTPIAALRGNAELALGERASPEDRRRVLVESIEEYDRLSRIADDLLLLARADSGREFLRRESVRLDAVVHDVVDLFAPLAQDRDVEVSCANGEPVSIVADGARLRQVLSNLLDNAVKYTPRGGRITVSFAEKNGMVELNVADTGPGIAAENLRRVFDRFYRADAARSRDAGGSGLGLAICHTIVAAHGGDIEARNGAVGSIFTVRLPTGITRPDR